MVTTTNGNLVAGKALAGQGGNGKGRKGRAGVLLATAALGLSLVIGGIFGQGRPAAQEAAPASTGPIASGGHTATMWDFREDRRAETRDLFVADQFTYREDRRVGSVAASTPHLDWATIYLIEQNQLPERTLPAAPAGVGPQEYLPTEAPTGASGTTPAPVFGPQP